MSQFLMTEIALSAGIVSIVSGLSYFYIYLKRSTAHARP